MSFEPLRLELHERWDPEFAEAHVVLTITDKGTGDTRAVLYYTPGTALNLASEIREMALALEAYQAEHGISYL